MLAMAPLPRLPYKLKTLLYTDFILKGLTLGHRWKSKANEDEDLKQTTEIRERFLLGVTRGEQRAEGDFFALRSVPR